MDKEKDFFKTCFNTVAGLEVKNESQAIAKEVVLSEIENLQQEDFEVQYWELQQENKILKENAENNDKVVDKVNWENMLLKKENKQLKDNWNKLREYIKETKLKEFEKAYGKRYGKTFTQAEIVVCNMILDKMLELEQGSDNK